MPNCAILWTTPFHSRERTTPGETTAYLGLVRAVSLQGGSDLIWYALGGAIQFAHFI